MNGAFSFWVASVPVFVGVGEGDDDKIGNDDGDGVLLSEGMGVGIPDLLGTNGKS